MDCLDGLKNLPDSFIDLTVTSPPYDNIRKYNGNVNQWSFEKFKLISDELFRVTKGGGVLVWIVADGTENINIDFFLSPFDTSENIIEKYSLKCFVKTMLAIPPFDFSL